MITSGEKLAQLHNRLEIAREPTGEIGIVKRAKKGIPSARDRIDMLLDPDSFVEIGALVKQPNDPGALYGDGVVTGHGTIDGRPVVVIAHDQTVYGGSVGEMFGRKVVFAVLSATVPIVTVVIRKAYGGAYAVMGCKQLGADINLAWPTARIAVMGAESAVSIVGRQRIAAAGEDAAAVRQHMIDAYNSTVATPWIAAERGYIDAVIEPAATRLELRKALNLLRTKVCPAIARKHTIYPL